MNDNRDIILLAATRIVEFGKPGTVKHSANRFEDRLEFSAEVEGKLVILFFNQHCYSLFNKAEGASTPVIYNATCTVDGVQAFANADCSLLTIQDIFEQVKHVMKRDKAHYFSKEAAFDFLTPPPPVKRTPELWQTCIEPFTAIDMPEPTEPGDDWSHEFQAQFVEYLPNGLARVVDGDNDYWDIEVYRLKISEDQ